MYSVQPNQRSAPGIQQSLSYDSYKAPGKSAQISVTSGGGNQAARADGPLFQSFVLSNIPRNISVASGLTSSNSIASERSHSSVQHARISDDETSDETSHGLKHCLKKSRELPGAEERGPAKKARVHCHHPVQHPPTTHPLRILARPEDGSVLNPLHVFVRQQIEVFTATKEDIAKPAPGRKNPIRLHQVGLRCIHCNHLPSRDRVKRAVCYPTSVGRLYHSVSDMKFDHFSNCKGLPEDLRSKLHALKAQCKRGSERRLGGGGSSSTAQYYHDSALRMGMEDCRAGIFMAGQAEATTTAHGALQAKAVVPTHLAPPVPRHDDRFKPMAMPLMSGKAGAPASTFSNMAVYHQTPFTAFQQAMAHGFNFQDPAPPPSFRGHVTMPETVKAPTAASPDESKIDSEGGFLLSTPSDPQYLNPLHCFVRRNVEVFVATEAEIAAPSPGRKNRVTLGQVGIRCIHCAKLPPKQRVKRAVCYPPSVGGIYHSVSNMKFDHFGGCRGLPDAARQEFTELRASFNRRGGSTSNGSRGMANSTAQFYHDSALRLGLADTAKGMRIVKTDQQQPDGISALVMAAANYPSSRGETANQNDHEQKAHTVVKC